MVGGSGEISPLPPTIFVMITNQKWQLYPLFVTEFYDGAGTAERSADLMDIIARLKKGDRLYIGAILGYHN